jgi:hypothetical protein
MKKYKIIIIIFIATLFIIGIGLNYLRFLKNPNPRLLPLDSKLPTNEIVFTPLDEDAMPMGWIGFMNLDGTGIEMRSYEVPTHLFMEVIPIKTYEQSLGRIFTWSFDGESVGGIFPVGPTNGQGYPVVVHMDGSISYCDPDESIIAQDRVLVLSNTEVLAIEELFDNENQRLVEFNMKTCQINKTLYIPQGNETLQNFSFSKNGWLAIQFGSALYWQRDPLNTDFVGIRIYDPTMNIVNEIKNATLPSLSSDGKKIAYVNETGEICVTDVDMLNPKCSGYTQHGISWSPDQQWLVYSTLMAEITLRNIASGEETIIGYGVYPNWRP